MGRDQRRRREARGLDAVGKANDDNFQTAPIHSTDGNKIIDDFLKLRPLDQKEVDLLEQQMTRATQEERGISFHLFRDGIACGLSTDPVGATNIHCVSYLDDPIRVRDWYASDASKMWGEVTGVAFEDYVDAAPAITQNTNIKGEF